MKLKEGFLLREVAGETVVIPSGEALYVGFINNSAVPYV